MSLFRRAKPATSTTTPVAPAPTSPAPTKTSPSLTIDPTCGDADAARLRDLITAGDWPAARNLLRAEHDDDDFAFLLAVASNVPGCEQWLPNAVRADLADPLPLLLYGTRAIRWAWEARSRARAQRVSRDQFSVFFERLRLAEDCLQDVVRRDPKNTSAWTGLVTLARGLELGLDEAQRRFDQVLEVNPTHFWAHYQMLQQLCRKWGGSHAAIHAFAQNAATAGAPGSRLGSLVATAHLEEWMDQGKEGVNYFKSSEILKQLHTAANRSVRHPDYRQGKGWPQDNNPFAMTFSLSGDQTAAAEQFRVIGNLVTELPWAHLSAGAVSSFTSRRATAYKATASP